MEICQRVRRLNLHHSQLLDWISSSLTGINERLESTATLSDINSDIKAGQREEVTCEVDLKSWILSLEFSKSKEIKIKAWRSAVPSFLLVLN